VSAVEIAVNTAVSCVPTNVTEAMITTAMRAAIRPYSMAVREAIKLWEARLHTLLNLRRAA
jgi:hypothetical protein